MKNVAEHLIDKAKAGIHKAIICKKCGHKVGYLKLKPALQDLLNKKNRKETIVWIFVIALVTQIISDIIIDLFKRSLL